MKDYTYHKVWANKSQTST